MHWHAPGISTDGEGRLRAALEAQLLEEHHEELAAVKGYWQKVALHERIRREVKKRMKELASPYSLWGS